jgi:hypothetical protein
MFDLSSSECSSLLFPEICGSNAHTARETCWADVTVEKGMELKKPDRTWNIGRTQQWHSTFPYSWKEDL